MIGSIAHDNDAAESIATPGWGAVARAESHGGSHGDGGPTPAALSVPDTGSVIRRAGGPWQLTQTPGFAVRPLLDDPATGLLTLLMRTEPGARAPLHSHADIEQVYVIAGSYSDGEAVYRPGDYVVRAPGTPHLTASDEGALSLVIYARAPRSSAP